MSELSVRETAARALDESPALGCGCCAAPAEDTEFDVEPGWRQVALADAVLAAVADHDGLADVLRDDLHVAHAESWYGSEWPDAKDCASCKRAADHLADVVRAWLRDQT